MQKKSWRSRVGFCVLAIPFFISAPVQAQTNCTPPPAGLVGWWKADGNPNDIIGGANGTVQAGAGFDSGFVGQAFHFTGATNSYVEVPDESALRLTNELTIEFWVKRLTLDFPTLPFADYIVEKGGDWTGSEDNYGVALHNPQYNYCLHFTFDGGWRGGGSVADTNWHHCAVTARQGDFNPTFYIDGVAQPAVYSAGAASIILYPSTRPMHVGAQVDPVTGWYYFSRTLVDELSIYNRVLSASEIQAIYNAGAAGKCTPPPPPPPCDPQPSGLVSWWRAEGNGTDSIGTNNATLSGGLSFTAGEVGQAFGFDGVDGRVVVSDSPSLDFGPGQDFSIEAWINPLTSTTDYGIMSVVDKRYAPNLVQSQGYEFNLANGQIHCRLSDNIAGNGAEFGPAGPDLRDGNFHHVALSLARSQTNGGNLFVDGQVVLNFDPTVVPGDLTTTEPFRIGNHASSFINAFFKGRIDEVSVYNRALSLAEIQGIFNAGSAGKCITTGQPPVIVSAPTNQIVVQGSTAVFNVEAAGSPPLSYQWFIAGLPVLGATNSELVLSNVQPNQAGTYQVVVSNPYGSIGAAAVLLVLTSPAITVQPHGTNIYVGSSATLAVTATGTAPLSFQWWKDGTPITSANNSFYTVLNAQLGNSGSYSVVVTNPYGAITSATAVVTVRVPPPCVEPPSGLVSWWRAENNLLDAWDNNNGIAPGPLAFGPGKVGRAFQNSFILVPDAPSLRLTNGLTIQAWVNPSIVPVSSMTIVSKFTYPPTSLLNTNGQSSFYLGLYPNGAPYLVVSPNGNAHANTILLSQMAAPLNQWSFVVATYDGAALRLYMNGTQIAQTPYTNGISASTSHLGIGGIPNSATFYYPFTGSLDEICLYNRALSDAEIQDIYASDVTGMCQVPPSIVAQPQSRDIPLGEDVLFSAGVMGTRPLRYQWSFNGQVLAGATNSTLLLEKVTTNQAGNYSLLVTNPLGSASSSNATLALLPRPTCVDLPAGAISWWPADGAPFDEIGSNNLTVLTAVFYPTGKVGRAFGLTNSTGGLRANLASSLNFGSNADFSIEMWVKSVPSTISRSPFSPPLNIPLATKQGTSFQFSAGMGYSLSLFEGRLAFWLGTNRAPVPIPGGSAQFISSGPDLRDGMFHHVAVSLQRSSPTGGNLYVDGQPVLTFDATRWSGSLSNSGPFILGAPGVQELTGDGYFSGEIDEAAVYGRALSADEIMGLAQAGAAGKCKVVPFITAQPTNQVAPLGGTATFSVGAGGTPTLRYQWRLNGVPMFGQTHSTLVFSNVQSSGLYSVVITNGFGRVISTNAALILNRPPIARCRNVVVAAGPDCLANASVDGGSFDPDGDAITLTQTPPGPYPIGTNGVLLTATDPFGASNTCAALVIVADQTPPTVTCPGNMIVSNAPNQCGAIVSFPPPTATDSCSIITNITANPPPGSFFPVGVTTVQCAATDAAGNVGTCSFTITVRDTQPPVITCPSDIVVTNAHDAWTTVVTYNPTVTDNCPGVGLPICNPPSGTAFGIGTHTVTCSAIDAAGNSSQCTFTVTVHPGNVPPVPIIDVSPVAMFHGFTNLFVIAPNGSNATVTFDGSRSYDVDDTNFNYYWYEGSTLLSTNVMFQDVLALGTHTITLLVDDTFPLGTNSASVTVEVISPAQAIEILIGMVTGSELSSRAQQPLLASLYAALAAFERGGATPTINQLLAFENKVQSQVAPTDPALAKELIQAAQTIIDSLGRRRVGAIGP